MKNQNTDGITHYSIRAEIVFGIGSDKNGKPISALKALAAIGKIENLACDIFGGFTWTTTQGGWRDAFKNIVIEEGRKITIDTLSTKRHEVSKLAEFIRDELRQSCVTLTITPVDFAFV